MFPLLVSNLEQLAEQDLSNGEKIQHLINLLSTDVLKMDLSHIKGEKIAEGNLQHLVNFLQLLFEVSKLYNEKKQESFHQDPQMENQNNSEILMTNPNESQIEQSFEQQYIQHHQEQNNSSKSQKSNSSKKQIKQMNQMNNKMSIQKQLKVTKPKPTPQLPSEEEVREFAQSQDISVYGRNVFEILQESIVKIKQSLEVMKTENVPEEDHKTVQQLLKQKNKYKTLLKRYVNYFNTLQQDQQLVQNKNFEKKIRVLSNKNKIHDQEFENMQKSLYFKLRDEKVNYLRKIHKIIFELEKRKILDEKKVYKEERDKRNEQTKLLIDQMENQHRDQVDMLRCKIEHQKNDRHTALVAQRQVISQLERELKQDKQQKIHKLYEHWNQEHDRFEHMLKDDGQLEKKIMDLYKNN